MEFQKQFERIKELRKHQEEIIFFFLMVYFSVRCFAFLGNHKKQEYKHFLI
ncbi:hypothetical protein AsAng_0041790 [Aureispira anguillae]|uniref:Uncharacterized protein n=1 Tax=Aureispira anguillae TaxID=2864201 RepID=A0A915YHT1_9BACT|nr:hypothetical protein AsAng_0041790 [Aureispira anguillae]